MPVDPASAMWSWRGRYASRGLGQVEDLHELVDAFDTQLLFSIAAAQAEFAEPKVWHCWSTSHQWHA